jgi:hypothetical protein
MAVINWKLIDLKLLLPNSYSPASWCKIISKFCQEEFDGISLSNSTIIIERQQQTRGQNGRGILPVVFQILSLENMIHMWFQSKGFETLEMSPNTFANFQDVYLEKLNYPRIQCKKAATKILVAEILTSKNLLIPKGLLQMYLNKSKQDDLADCMGMAYVHILQTENISALSQELEEQ